MSQPSITQLGQYLKDLSFENLAATTPTSGMPAIDLNVNLDIKPFNETKENDLIAGEYEVSLSLRVNARPISKSGEMEMDKVLFITEVSYAGRYQVANVPPQDLEYFLMIEAPRLLYPFARQVVADASMHGGLPPLLLAPIDFMQMYQQRKNQAA